MNQQRTTPSTQCPSVNMRISKPWIFLAFLAIYIALVTFGASKGIRGTDQYWYVADIEMLAEQGQAYSNNLYPPSVLENRHAEPRPFIHNTLYVYLAAIPARFFGAFNGSIIFNVFLYILATVILYLTLRKLKTNPNAALTASGIFLLLPMNYWLSANAMSEAILVPCIMFLGWLAASEQIKAYHWILGLLTLIALLFMRESLIILALLLPATYILHQGFNKPSLLTASGLLIIIVAAYKIRGILFPHNEACSLAEMVLRTTPNVTDNMFCYFNVENVKIDPTLWKIKILANLKKQFELNNSIALTFFWPTNILIILGSVFSIFQLKNAPIRRLFVLLSGLIITHLATLVLVENLPRYLVILPPIAFILTTIAIVKVTQQHIPRLLAISAIGLSLTLTAVDTMAGIKIRRDATEQAQWVTQLRELMAQHTDQSNKWSAIIETIKGDNVCLLGYALNSNQILFTRSLYPDEIKHKLIGKMQPEFIIVRENSSLDTFSSYQMELLGPLPSPFGTHTLYRTKYATDK